LTATATATIWRQTKDSLVSSRFVAVAVNAHVTPTSRV
jgi:hypothetical protein